VEKWIQGKEAMEDIALVQRVGWYVHNTNFHEFVSDLFSDMDLQKHEAYLKEKWHRMTYDPFGFFNSLDWHRKVMLVKIVRKRYDQETDLRTLLSTD
jgi:hypothetical protein